MSVLLVSRKNTDIPAPISQAFRQIEFWANQQLLNPFTLTPPFSAFSSGYATPGWIVDPFGVIHLQGEILYTGTLPSGAFSSPIAPIPNAVTPATIHNFSINLSVAYVITPGILQATPTEIRIASGTSLTNPTFSLDGITYFPNY
jgi:hypothetical protein